ncbi:MAG: MBG domain-containing protein [Armatimonadota bacterium]
MGIDVSIRAYAPTTNAVFVGLYDNGVLRGGTQGPAIFGWGEDGHVLGWYSNNGWTPAKLNTTNFKVKITNGDDDEDVYLDGIALRIYYAYGCVTTGAASSVTTSSASIEGSYSSWLHPEHPVLLKGFDYWNTSGGATIQLYESASSDSGTMSSNLSGLLSNSRYGYKAGIGYGPDNLYEYGATLYFVTLPVTTTLAADTITSTSARLRGTVNPEGSQALSNGFYYSATANTEEALKVLTPVPAGTAEGDFSATLNGITPETTYYYLAYSTNSGGASYGSVQSFTTPAALPVITTHPADQSITYGANASFTAAAQGNPLPTVQWQVSPNGVDWSNITDGISTVTTSTSSDTVTSMVSLTKPPVSYSGYMYRALFINPSVPSGVPTTAASLTVSMADANIIVNGWSGIYDGAYHGATVDLATGVGGEDLRGSVIIGAEMYKDVPGGMVAWSLSNPNYNSLNGVAEITITPADAVIVVNGWSGMYDGAYHGATVDWAAGGGGEDLRGSVTIGTETYKDVPGGTVAWWFENPNYNPQSGIAEITITPADAVIVVNGWNGVYDGAYHGATLASATGVGGEDLSGSVIIGTETYKDVPGSRVAWSFSNPNYNPQRSRVVIFITPADAAIVVNGWSGMYDGAYHGATLTSATGVGGEDLRGSVIIGTETYTDVPGGTVAWSFSNLNYNPLSGIAEITITKAHLTVTADDKTSQYSDGLQTLTYTMTGFIGSENSSVITGLPAGMSTTATQTSAAGEYPITVDVTGLSATNYDFTTVKGTYTMTKEDAVVSFANTATFQLVATPGGAAPAFSLQLDLHEKIPDSPTATAAAGDVEKLVGSTVKITLSPIGPGASVVATGTITAYSGTGYDGMATVTVDFAPDVAVNTYEVTVELIGNEYFQLGPNASVFTVYDPSLGFTTGGGWFYWPGTQDKTNFGYSIQYGKNGSNVKGGLLLIRHLQNGDIYRVKSNALDNGTLTLGTTDLPMGWASFSGKCTFTSILSDVATTSGNIPFKVYVEDRNDPGTLTDRFWIQVTGCASLCLPTPPAANSVAITGGNIVVPHAATNKKK